MTDGKDKILLITGASSDVGMELLESIYSSYKCMYLQYRQMNERLESIIKIAEQTIEIVPIECDLRSKDNLSAMIQDIAERQKLPNHIVHLPAPKVHNGYFHKKSLEAFDEGWQVSVKPIIMILQSFLPYMAKDRYGRILFMLSSYTLGVPPKFLSDYVTIKYSLLGLMKSLSEEYKEKGITVNGVSPDMMETKFLSEVPRLIVENYAEKRATGRNVRVREILPIIEYILSDEGASMTGQNICIGER